VLRRRHALPPAECAVRMAPQPWRTCVQTSCEQENADVESDLDEWLVKVRYYKGEDGVPCDH
jgi:hypothetical protein